MNSLWRVVWKEYRTQRALWLAILVTAIALQFFFFVLTDVGPSAGPFGTALTFSMLYALASGAVLFAAEREEGTREFLRTLAVPAGRLLAGKLGFAAASTTLMFAVLWLIAAAMYGELSPALYFDTELNAWQAGGLLAVEVVLWAVFFSLVVQRVLSAVCLTAITVVTLHSPQLNRLIGIQIEGLSLHLPYPVYALAALLLIDLWLTRRWMGSRAWIPSAVAHASTRAELAQASVSASLQSYAVETSPLWRPLQRLLWQEWRQARAFLAINLIVCGTLLLISGAGIVSGGRVLALFILPSAPLLMGVWAFHAEQQGQRFHFLAERGIAPPAVWLSKQTVWLPAAFVVSLMLLATYWAGQSFAEHWPWPNVYTRGHVEEDPFRSMQPFSFVVLLYVAVSYGIGQFVSLLLPRAVTAGFIGLVLNYLLLCWVWLMHVAQVPLLWSVGAIPLVLLAATLLRSTDWMLQRNSLRAWLRFSLALVVPTIALIAGVASFRVWEIPARGPGFVVDNVGIKTQPDEFQAAEFYRQASEALVSSAKIAEYKELPAQAGWLHATIEERQWLRENQPALELTLLATARRNGAFAVQHDVASAMNTRTDVAKSLGSLLLLSARQLEANGELDKALERYIAALRLARHVAHRGRLGPWLMGNTLQRRVYQWLMLWAADPEQHQQKLADALKRIEAESSDFPPASTALKIEYLAMRTVFATPEARAKMAGGLRELLVMQRLTPWEAVRARRLLDAVTADSFARLLVMEELLKRPGVDLVDWQKNPFARGQAANTLAWVQTTPHFPEFLATSTDNLVVTAIDTQTYRSGCLLRLGLLRWRLENGQLPPRLDDLTGPARSYVLDPWSGRLFGYLPQGPGAALTFANLETSQPLVWSPGVNGANVIPLDATEADRQHFQVVAGWTGVRPQPGVGGIGLAFPIPISYLSDR